MHMLARIFVVHVYKKIYEFTNSDDNKTCESEGFISN